VTSYTVYKNGTSIGTATNTNFAVTGLSPSTTYSFTVAASDSAGISPQSSAVSVTTGASGGGNTPPGTYTITVSGTAGGVTHSAQLTLKVN
jgi:chitodextrinase